MEGECMRQPRPELPPYGYESVKGSGCRGWASAPNAKHDARRQALRYAMQKYGHFREVQLEPYPPR